MENIQKLREIIKFDMGLFVSLDSSLETIDQWLYGNCFGTRALSSLCRHNGCIIKPPASSDDGTLDCIIVGIPRPQALLTIGSPSLALHMDLSCGFAHLSIL